MVILTALMVYSAFWAATRLPRDVQRARNAHASTHQAGHPSAAVSALLQRANRARTPGPIQHRRVRSFPEGAVTATGTQAGLAWTALDDLQLTRLLTDAARRTNTE